MQKAEGFYADSQFTFYPPFSPGTSGYLLHLAIELYLKAFLIDRGQFGSPKQLRMSGHDLERLFKRCVRVEKVLLYAYQDQKTDQLDWMKRINPFGYPDGGVRYALGGKPRLDKDIHNYFDNLVGMITDTVNGKKVITDLVYE